MKINKKLFDSLTREPNEVQIIDGKKLEIFFMTEEEKAQFDAEEDTACGLLTVKILDF